MYTKEQNEEIEKVCRVFDSYIRENPYFDVVWSDKLGYILKKEGVNMYNLIIDLEMCNVPRDYRRRSYKYANESLIW